MAYDQIPEPCDPVQFPEFFAEDRRFPAVYFLHLGGCIVYVGRSRTLKWRIEEHLGEASKSFDAISFIRCGVNQLAAIETHYIRKLAPRYNDCALARAIRAKDPWKFVDLNPGLPPRRRVGPSRSRTY